MTHFQEICEFGQVHGQCRCYSPVKIIRNVKCNMVRKHKSLVKKSQAAEINHETQVATNLYRLETFHLRHRVTVAAANELAKVSSDLRKALDMEPPDDVA